MSRHADRIFSTIEGDNATSAIVASWRRCACVYRLDPDASAAPDPDSRALRDAQHRDAKIIATAGPYIDQLFECLDDPDGGVTLVDKHGLMIALRVGSSHDVHERKLARWLGADVSERRIGTNGNGTCLAEERPVVVNGEAHFLSDLTPTICLAAPIFGPDGHLVACLNVLIHTADKQLETFVRLAVAGFARRIEVELFAAAFPKARLVLASEVGREPGAVIAVDRDDLVVGATRAARRLLGLDDRRLANGVDLAGLRGATVSDDLAAVQRKLILRALAKHDGNVSRAAKAIGISRSTFYRKAGDALRGGGRDRA